eukprot:TRINITY_DN16572_c0_g1_i1.p1 TRINITY_DN16572_c0_g1~~TRINITY_DN16572_c0_g1_i1.p1  ORF type:complete len:299 (+),score=73.13 TRINITY_DN16572_c0_g1_i1:103-999(+)
MRCLTFEITNAARADRPPLTTKMVAEILAGGTFERNSVLSEHLGLRHLFLAAEVNHMDLHLFQADDVVVLRASLMVNVEVGTWSGSDCRQRVDEAIEMLPPGLRIVAIDDSDVARRLLVHVLAKHAPNARVQVLGRQEEDVERFKEEALGDVDIIILDNHLSYGHVEFLGTEILNELHAEGYRGFACIRSANMCLEDRDSYLSCGANCMLGKDITPQEMLSQLRVSYDEFLATNAALFSTPPGRRTSGSRALCHGSPRMGGCGAASWPPVTLTPISESRLRRAHSAASLSKYYGLIEG